MKLFFDYGQDVNVVDSYGCSILHIATFNGCIELVQYLLKNTNIYTKLKILKRREFKINTLRAGETAIDIAKRFNWHEIFQALKVWKTNNQVHNLVVVQERIKELIYKRNQYR